MDGHRPKNWPTRKRMSKRMMSRNVFDSQSVPPMECGLDEEHRKAAEVLERDGIPRSWCRLLTGKSNTKYGRNYEEMKVK